MVTNERSGLRLIGEEVGRIGYANELCPRMYILEAIRASN